MEAIARFAHRASSFPGLLYQKVAPVASAYDENDVAGALEEGRQTLLQFAATAAYSQRRASCVRGSKKIAH